jgi:hypothetical protein
LKKNVLVKNDIILKAFGAILVHLEGDDLSSFSYFTQGNLLFLKTYF